MFKIFLEKILFFIQPVAVVVFAIAGIISLVLGKTTQGIINLCFAVANYFIFFR